MPRRTPSAPLSVVPLSLAAVAFFATGAAQAATPTFYDDSMTFQTDITFNVTDPYSNPAYVFIQNNAVMSAVLGETDYFTTGFMDLNIVSGGYYCAGCNGSFELTFTSTTVGDATGVNGVGVNIVVHDMGTPYFAFITYADGTQEDVALPPSGNFWGVSAPERIESIHFGLSMGGATTNGSFGIDDLIIGDGFDMTPCGDGDATPDEECDDAGESAACDANCTLAACGDNTLNVTAGEICDEGAATPTCNADCTAPICGDGVINMPAGETCDDIGESPTCDLDCTAATCGDGYINAIAGEVCDDSAESPSCDPDCTPSICGDGYENNTAGEYCDDGNNDDGDGCSATCTEEAAGSSSEGGGSSEGTSDGGSTDGGDTTIASVGTDSGGETGSTGGEETGVDTSGSASGGMTGSASMTGGAESSGGGESSGGASASGGSNDDSGGCGCTTDGNSRAAWSLLLVAGALGRRRRRAS